MTAARPQRRRELDAGQQLTLGDSELGRDDHIDVVILDRYGRVLDTIPAHLGDRTERRERPSLHEAALFGYVTTRHAEECLPPPTWATLPCHDHDSPVLDGDVTGAPERDATRTERDDEEAELAAAA